MMIAEELPLDWDTIRIEAAPTEKQYYSPIWGVFNGWVCLNGESPSFLCGQRVQKPERCSLPQPPKRSM